MRRKRGAQLRISREAEAPSQREPARWPGSTHLVPFEVPEPPAPPSSGPPSEPKAHVRPPFLRLVSDETLRIELGRDVVAALALENLDLSSPASSEAVRRFIITHRAG